MKNGKLGAKKIAIIAAAVLAGVAAVFLFFFSNRLSATTMRLLKTQGVVKLFEKEKEKTIKTNLRLANGNVLNTDTESLAAIALDDTKIVTINDSSRAQFDQKGKKLNIKLTDGSLFFEVTKKLEADETFDIKTSTMVVGIRGTSGYVSCDEDGYETLYITDGKVFVIGTNPVTGEVKEIYVEAGQRLRVYLYNDRTVDSIMFELENVTEDDLQQAIKDRLIENETLMEKVCANTGWSAEKIMGIEEIPETMTATDPGEFITDENEAAENEEVAGAEETADEQNEEAEPEAEDVKPEDESAVEETDAEAEAEEAETSEKKDNTAGDSSKKTDEKGTGKANSGSNEGTQNDVNIPTGNTAQTAPATQEVTGDSVNAASEAASQETEEERKKRELEEWEAFQEALRASEQQQAEAAAREAAEAEAAARQAQMASEAENVSDEQPQQNQDAVEPVDENPHKDEPWNDNPDDWQDNPDDWQDNPDDWQDNPDDWQDNPDDPNANQEP
ncbi:FecR family protein [Butyrivibrio sp. YAB3001]|uniref:FecR family protein n=1 Tax=Butyrivibrio sp. YAB3001 TaxID=1520812 RepID=UPI0008F68F13|nr:FecR family protein [Butyrivibrio sp. YAB3001]SFB83014.1 FecR family protein [Butyrivibrio sp. YAB3001]